MSNIASKLSLKSSNVGCLLFILSLFLVLIISTIESTYINTL